MRIFQPTTGGGGGGGSPGGPDQSIQYNNGGSFFGDSLATRDPSTNETFIGRAPSSDITQGFEVTGTLAGGLDGAVAITSDTNANTSAFNGIFDLTPFGGSSTVAGIIALDSMSNFQTLIVQPDSIIGSITDGSQESTIELEADEASLRWTDGTDSAQFIANPSFALMRWSKSGPDYGWGADVNGVGFYNGNIQQYRMPTADGTTGQALVTNGAGVTSFQTISATVSLNQYRIPWGNASNQLDSNDNLIYVYDNYKFQEFMPNNINGGVALGSPLSFGPASFTGSGLDDLTLNWSVSNYQSLKYGGNLTVQIDGTGTPDTFSWFFTGGYSQMIGSGTLVPITGSAQVLTDNNGNVVAEITFGATTGHTSGDRWNAGTSLSTVDWGHTIEDRDGHQFLRAFPVFGSYTFGDDYDGSPTALNGNNTVVDINDLIGEMALYAKRYFRVENPDSLGTTLVLADMGGGIWSNYGVFRVLDSATSSIWFDANSASRYVSMGDVQSAGNDTLFTVNDNLATIVGMTSGSFQLQNTSGQSFFYAAPNSVVVGRNSSGNNTNISVDDSNENMLANLDGVFRWQTTAGQTKLLADLGNSVVSVQNARLEGAQGASVAAANDLTLGTGGNTFEITGNTTINAITTANWQNGSHITLVFSGTPTVKNNTAGGAGTASILLAGSVDLTAALNTVLGLVLVGGTWQETFRKVA